MLTQSDGPPPDAFAGTPWRRLSWAVLALAAILRIVLVFRGGQFSQLDENRYFTSRDAALEISQGHLVRGIALPLEGGDHVGYKELGTIPALIERAAGGDRAWIPGLFFGTFSVLVIGLLGGIAWRLSGSRPAQFWAVFAAACSGSLFYFARHLLPYDASMCLILLGIYLAVGSRQRWWRFVLSGFVVGLGFVTYYGYWTLGGFALAMAAVCGSIGWKRSPPLGLFLSAALLAIGFSMALALPVAINHAWGTGHMVQGARDLSGSIVTGDFRGHVVPWEYLWYTDYLELPIAIIFMSLGLLEAWSDPEIAPCRRRPRPEFVNAACFLGVYTVFIVTGTLLHKFAVHDRLVRQLLPFMILGFAFGAAGLGNGVGKQREQGLLRSALAAVLAANAAFAFSTPFAQEWPRAFRKRGDAILAKRTDPVSSGYYFRYVNVLQYYFEPEVLKVRPQETLLASPHFFQYRPYLYEAKTPEDRARREEVDSSMRLVKVPILPSAKIGGDGEGAVTLRIRLPLGRLSYLEPLLSMGPRGDGDLFFIRYYSDSSVALGFFSTGEMVYEADRVDVVPGSVHEVTMFCGDLLQGRREAAYDELRKQVLIRFDGNVILQRTARPKGCPPQQVYAGVSAIVESYTAEDFSGEILSATRSHDLSPFMPSGAVHP
jgi:hypothetical protein